MSTLNTTRFLSMESPTGSDKWYATELEGSESVNTPFEYTLSCVSTALNLTHIDLMAKPISVCLGKTSSHRFFHGVIHSVQVGAQITRHYQQYTLTVVPWLAFWGDTMNCRVFQNKSVIDIFKSMCQSYQFSDYHLSGLTHTYDSIPYCTQYNESDLQFINRLFQQAGISYTFEHQSNTHTLVLFDALNVRPKIKRALTFNRTQKAQTVIHEWIQHYQWHSNKNSALDFDYIHPEAATSTTLTHAKPSTISGRDIFKHTSYANPTFQAASSLSYLQHLVTAKSNDVALKPGWIFTLNEHSDPTQEGDYGVLSIKHHATDHTGLPFAHTRDASLIHVHAYDNEIECFSTEYDYSPLKNIPWPLLGEQTATVVGTTENEPQVDQYAKIKIQFHWDREGQYTSSSSCWIRVAQGHAGKHHGFQFLPRVGAEVLVSFVGGNPDKPQIIGVAPNQLTPLPFPVNTRPNVSGFKSRTIGSTGATSSNELSFDDTKANPVMTMLAQNVLNISAKGNETLSVGNDFKHIVSGDHAMTSRDSVTYQAKDQINIDAGHSSITLTPDHISIETPDFSTGMPSTPQTLAAKVPVYVSTAAGNNINNTVKDIVTKPGMHWVQGEYLDSTGKGLNGMLYSIQHSDGTLIKGTLDASGKTQKVSQLHIGTATITYGDRAKLETQLAKQREQLQSALDEVLSKIKAYVAAHPDKTINENWVEKDFNRSVAFVKGVGTGAIKTVKSAGVGIVHLFKDMARSEALEDQGMLDTLSGNTQDLAKVDQASIAEGSAMFRPIAKGVKLMHLIFEDAKTRQMLENFAQDYYHSETPIMVDKQIGAAVGGIALGLIVAVITDNPTAIVSGLADKVSIGLARISAAANKIADILRQLKETKTLEGVALDKKHVSVIRPEGVDEGAQHISQAIKHKANKAQELTHPSGAQYHLPAVENKNFSGKPISKVLPPGKKIYRVVERNPEGVNGRWWAYELPESKQEWRAGFAVKRVWNENGYYVEHTVGSQGLAVWEGKAASQTLSKEGFPGWLLEGGNAQIFVPQSLDEIPEDLSLTQTVWSK